jgi:hypothetical protein
MTSFGLDLDVEERKLGGGSLVPSVPFSLASRELRLKNII